MSNESIPKSISEAVQMDESNEVGNSDSSEPPEQLIRHKTNEKIGNLDFQRNPRERKEQQCVTI